MKKAVSLLCFLIAILGFSISAIKTDHAVILYEDGLSVQASFVGMAYETYKDSVINLIGNDPGNVTILLKSSGAITNGMANQITNTITVLSWPQPSPFLNFDSWYETVIIHEFSHISHLNCTSGFNALVKILFGLPVFDSQPRSPFVEAVPVYSESNLLGSSGRINNPVIDSAVLSYIKNRNPSLARISSPAEEDFMGYSMYYFIPSRFYSYLNKKFSNGKVKDFLKDFSGNFMGLCISYDFKKAFGSSPNTLFERWKDQFKNKSFSQGESLVDGKGAFISRLHVYKNGIYYTEKFYGKKHLYGWNGYKLYRWRDGRNIFIKDLSSVIDFKISDDKLYILESYIYKSSLPFSYYKRRIVQVNMNTGKEKIIADGLISSFDVYNEEVAYSIYDPKTDESIIYTKKGKITVKGFAREIAIDNNKLAILIASEYSSSKILIYENGRKTYEINDDLFKYSIGWDKNMLYFVGLSRESADVYGFCKGKFYQLTERFAFYNANVVNENVYGTIFSQNYLGTKIIKAKLKKIPYTPRSPVIFKVKRVTIKKINPWGYYIEKTFTPVAHIPIAFKNGSEWIAGVILGGTSPDLSLIWVVAPVVFKNLKPDIYGGFYLNLNDLTIQASKISSETSIRSSLTVRRFRFSTSSRANLGISAGFYSNGSYSLSTFWDQYISSLSFGINAGWGDKGPLGNLLLKFYEGDFIIKTSLGYYGNIHGGAGVVFPIWFGDLGIFDPLLDLSHIFGDIEVGYDDGLYLSAMLGSEIADFATYNRSFPKIGFVWSKDGVRINYGFGF